MTLQPRRMTYSQKNGYTFEFDQPSTMNLTPQEIVFLLGLLGSTLSQKELDTHFLPSEQHIVTRYMQLCHEKLTTQVEDLAIEESPLSLPKRLKKQLAEWMAWSSVDVSAMAAVLWGWQIVSTDTPSQSLIDQLIEKGLAEGNYPKHYFEKLLREDRWGEMSLEVFTKLEARYGPFNLDSI